MFIKMRYYYKIIVMLPYKRYKNLKKSYIIHTFFLSGIIISLKYYQPFCIFG
jgi:hypothetical protein